MSYGLEEKSRARQLFVEDGLNYDEVAEETAISIQTIKKWGGEGGWVAAQKEFEREYMELTTNVHKLKLETVKNALASKHSQDIIAATNLLKAMPVSRKGRGQFDRAAYFLEIIDGEIKYLKERDPEALRYLEPHLRGFAESMKEAG